MRISSESGEEYMPSSLVRHQLIKIKIDENLVLAVVFLPAT